jgi:hypothetical protein
VAFFYLFVCVPVKAHFCREIKTVTGVNIPNYSPTLAMYSPGLEKRL